MHRLHASTCASSTYMWRNVRACQTSEPTWSYSGFKLKDGMVRVMTSTVKV